MVLQNLLVYSLYPDSLYLFLGLTLLLEAELVNTIIKSAQKKGTSQHKIIFSITLAGFDALLLKSL
ncbi:MAG: hypothetical protein ACI9DK_000864 [Vicingaceae bacterium]|jgi:hypothetical protein